MRWTYQPTVFNTNPKCSIPSQSIRCWPRVFNTKACQCTVFNSQYSSSIHEVDIPTHSGGQRTPRVPLQFPPFLLTLLSYWASSTSITSGTIPTLYLFTSSFYFFLFLLLPRSTKHPSKDPWPSAPWQPHSIHSPPYMLRSTIVVDIIIISLISK